MEDHIELGGSINLIGFKDLEPAKLVVVKKIVGNFIKKVQDHHQDFQKITVTMKKVHESKFEVMTHLIIKDKNYTSEVTDFNLFFALNSSLEKIIEQT